jgi:uncharacterized membrane-anchored protein
MLRYVLPVTCLLLTPAAGEAKTYEEMFGTKPTSPVIGGVAALNAMDFKEGAVALTEAHARLDIPAGYYFLDRVDAGRVLVDLWGNPRSETDGTLGMIFPKSFSPGDPKAWGAVISYSPDGYVSDADAEATDFDDVLTQLKSDTDEGNEERRRQGFDKITLLGWASPPHYDKTNHTIHWARELLFGDDPNAPHTLNYQLRALAREGVLNYNFVAGMGDLEAIKTSIPTVTAMVKFDPGKTYGDYKDGDKIAAYGLAGLIAAGAGAKIAAKIGLLGLALVFLKKGAVFILIAAGAIFKPILNLFRRKPDSAA